MIKPPAKLDPRVFDAMIQDWLDANTWTSPEGIVACKKCDTPVEYDMAYVSIHDAGWSRCAGWGECNSVGIPYCPKCEPKPFPNESDRYTCVHVSSEPAPKPRPFHPRQESKPGLKLPGGYRLDFTGFPWRTVIFAAGMGVFGGSMMSTAMFDSAHKHIPIVTYVEMIGGGLAVLISAILQIVRPR